MFLGSVIILNTIVFPLPFDIGFSCDPETNVYHISRMLLEQYMYPLMFLVVALFSALKLRVRSV